MNSADFVKNKLFTPFVQADNASRTSYMGTGLGMPIVKAIPKKMNGSITVECSSIFKMFFEAMNHKKHYDMIYGSHEGGFFLCICSIKVRQDYNETK